MRTLTCFLGFVCFGLVLFFLLGDALVDEAWLDALGGWAWLAAIGLMIADIAIPIPTTLVITVMGQKYGPLLGGLIGTLGMFSAGVVAYGLTRLLGLRFARWLLADELDRAHQFFATKGAFAVACSRWLPLLPEAI
ncbi:MAG: VTT domain-containing protein, partial [Gemmataceae bacterium]